MATDYDTDAGEERTHEDRKQAYERVLNILRLNTHNEEQPPALRSHGLFQVVQQSSLGVEEARLALRAAVENDAVVKFKDHEGDIRYTLAEEERLVASIGWLTDVTDHPPRDEIAWLNQVLQEVRDDA